MDNQRIDASKGQKVLIVDDVPENIQVLVHLLNEKGLRVNYADSGIKALKAIKSNLPDLILLDVSMPQMDGFQVCERLKGDPLTADIPVIFLTAKVDQQDVINGLEKGAVDYVTKPFNAGELIKRVFTHLELKQSRDIIKKQNIELLKLNDVKNQLFSVISHDMKNLFNNILFGTESLEKEIDNFEKEEVVQMAGLVNDSAKRAYDLLQNLLDWSKSQMNSIKFIPVEFEMLLLVNQVVALFSPSIRKKNITIMVKPQHDIFIALADIDMIKVVLRNLLSNAIKYSWAKGEITVLLEADAACVKVSVIDNGVGMSSVLLKKLRNNRQSHASIPGTQNEKGSGLGLLLIKDFVHKNNGQFDFDSNEGKGSTFWFTVPRKP